MESGKVDLISGAFNTPERREYALFSSTNTHSPNILFLRSGEESKWKLNSLADITSTPFILGIQINVSYSNEFDLLKEQHEFTKHLETNSNRMSLWRMLTLKRVDGVIADKITGLIELKSLGLKDKIIPSSLIVSNEPSFFAFSKKTTTQDFVDQFDAVFLGLIKDGTINTIENTYTTQ